MPPMTQSLTVPDVDLDVLQLQEDSTLLIYHIQAGRRKTYAG